MQARATLEQEILNRLDMPESGDPLASILDFCRGLGTGASWNELASYHAASIPSAGLRARLSDPRNVVCRHAKGLSSIISEVANLSVVEIDDDRVDLLLVPNSSYSSSTRDALIVWICVEVSLSTVRSHRSRSAVAFREEDRGFVIRALTPPRLGFLLNLFGSFGTSLSTHFQQHHQLLLDASGTVDAVEQVVEREEQRLMRLLGTLDQGYIAFDASGRAECSTRFRELTGMDVSSFQELILQWCEQAPVEHLNDCEIVFRDIAAGVRGTFHLTLVRDGMRHFEVVVADSESGWSATFEDITAEFEARRATATRRDALHSMLEAAPFAIAVHLNDRLLFANKRFDDRFDGIRDSLSTSIAPKNSTTTFLPTPLLEVPDRAGSLRAFEHSSTVVTWGGSGAMLTVFREVTDERAFLARSFELDRIVALGTLADGVAHEINNPLAYVHSNIDFALRVISKVEFDDRDELTETLEDALDGAERVSELVADFRNVAPAGTLEELESVDVEEVISSAINVVKATVRSRANITTSVNVHGYVEASASRLAQVLINLLVNAAQAIPDERRGQIHVTAVKSSANRVRIEVRDNGSGIPEEAQELVFKPFFTTKPAGEGTGLGLSICKNIIHQFGGTMSLESREGVGTTIAIELPLSEAPRDEVRVFASEASEAISYEAQVLVVDDDPQITRVVARVLQDFCAVWTCNDSATALQIARDNDFDVILTDVAMPGIQGGEIIASLLRERPEYLDRIVIMSGGRATTPVDDDVPRLEKPFGMRDLRTCIREVLARQEVA